MKMLVIATVAVASLAGAARAELSDRQYLEAARCRALAASDALGKLDTAGIDTMLRGEGATRTLATKTSAINKMASATKDAASADEKKKAKLLAERDGPCAAYLAGAK